MAVPLPHAGLPSEGQGGPGRYNTCTQQAARVAGIYNAINTEAGLLLSAAMLTRDPGLAMSKIHDREPVVIEPEDFAAWLDGSDDLDLFVPLADDVFVSTPA